MTDVLASPELPAFVIAALRWVQEPDDERARVLITNPHSGVPNEVANALVTIAHREGTLLNAISHERLALPADERDIVMNFSRKLGMLARAYRAHSTTGTELLQTIATEFALPSLPTLKAADSPKNIEEVICEIEKCAAAEDRREQAMVVPLKEKVTPEAPLPLRTRHSHFSASSLNTYVDCKRKWFYRYMCAAVEDRGSSASFFGSAFHAALEGLHTEFPRPSEVPQATLRSKLDGYLNAAFDRYRRGFDTSIEFELQRRRARRTAQRYLAWLSARAARSPFTVIGCELSAQIDLEGFEFIGYIDRLDRDDATQDVTVIDYKTGVIAQSADEYREKVRRFKDFQLPFYYWARSAAGDHVSRLALVPLKDALLEVAPIELEVVPARSGMKAERWGAGRTGTISIGELERARAKMVDICRALTEGSVQHFVVTEDPAACKYCPYLTSCRLRPSPLEEKFAR